MFLMCRITESKRRHGQEQNELNKQRITEKELTNLNQKINKLLNKLEEHEQEVATSIEEECVICIAAKASVTTYPCNHCVICRRCFVKTIQNAVSQKNLPLRCVICRAKILRLKQSFTSDLLLESNRSGKYKRTGRASQYGYPPAAKAGASSKNKNTCKKRMSLQQAAINQNSSNDQRATIEKGKPNLKIANDSNSSGSSKQSTASSLAGGRQNGRAEIARTATLGAAKENEPIESNGQLNGSNESCPSNTDLPIKIEEEVRSNRSLSPELESSRKRIEKLNKLTSEKSLNHQRTLKGRIFSFNYFSLARATPKGQCEEEQHARNSDLNGVQESQSIGGLVERSREDSSDCRAPKKKTTWSNRFQKFKSKTNACLTQVRIMFDL